MKGGTHNETAHHRPKTGITYTLHGDYYLPDCSLPAEEEIPIGVWGNRHAEFLKNHQRGVYNEFLVNGKLQRYLTQIDRDAQEMFDLLVRQFAEQEGVTEQIKAENQMEWVMKMNSIRNRATEIVNKELIFL